MSLDLTEFMEKNRTWKLQDDKLVASLAFSNFEEAFAFMTQVASIAERLNHHPNWSNSYNKVTIELYSHDAGKVTGRDLELAQAIQELL